MDENGKILELRIIIVPIFFCIFDVAIQTGHGLFRNALDVAVLQLGIPAHQVLIGGNAVIDVFYITEFRITGIRIGAEEESIVELDKGHERT